MFFIVCNVLKRGGAEEACLAHNQKVKGSKPFPAMYVYGCEVACVAQLVRASVL